MIKFHASDAVKTAVKTFGTPIDVTDYNTLIFSIWSQTKGINKDYLKPADFVYKIDIDGVLEFYIPALFLRSAQSLYCLSGLLHC